MESIIIADDNTKQLIFSKEEIQLSLETASNQTPYHLYHGDMISNNAKHMMNSFKNHFKDYRNYFAVKATPNPHLLFLLKQKGMGVDCSSLAELLLSEKVGFKGDEIMFTSNNTPSIEYQKANELGAIINLDDITQIDYMMQSLDNKLPTNVVSLRYNPGPLKKGNAIIGEPQEAKFGLTRDQLTQAYSKLKALGVSRFGLHCMVASNELQLDYFEETAKLLFTTVAELTRTLDIQFEMVNLGGGVGIPYRPDQKRVDFEQLSLKIAQQYKQWIEPLGDRLINIVTECGRVVSGPYGCLVTRAIHTKSTYKQYVGVDACMANLMRPGMYGAYHHISVIKQNHQDTNNIDHQPHHHHHQQSYKYDIVGSLCENNDKFAINREMPQEIETNDILVVHDTGAHGHSMGFNYNGKLRSAEYLLLDGKITLIRRAETYNDLFATLDFSKF